MQFFLHMSFFFSNFVGAIVIAKKLKHICCMNPFCKQYTCDYALERYASERN